MLGKFSLVLIVVMPLAACTAMRPQTSTDGLAHAANAVAGTTDDQQRPPAMLRIDHQGSFYWNFIPVDETGLKAQFAVVSRMANQLAVEVIIDKRDAGNDTVKTALAKVLADAAQYKISKVFVKER